MCSFSDSYLWTVMMLIVSGVLYFVALLVAGLNSMLERRINERAKQHRASRGGRG